jgi:fatty acid desaturase
MSTFEADIAANLPPQQPTSRPPEAPSGNLYPLLMRQIKDAGLLQRRTGYYIARLTATTVLLAAGWAAFVLIGDSWWQLAVAVFLAVVFTQLGFVGHEAGHRQISASQRTNDLIGLLYGDLAIGLSFGWWVDKHNRHHAHPNQEGKDPDIEIGALAFTASQARDRGPVARFTYRYQAYLFFPLLLLEAVNLHVSSVQALIGSGYRQRTRERVLFAAHVVGYLAAVFLVLSPVRAIVVMLGLLATLIISYLRLNAGRTKVAALERWSVDVPFGLYLGCSFAPNHKGMAILAADDRSDFLRRQVLTSRNVRGNWIVDVGLGGLNYQIEHHLFPSMPQPNLRRARPIVRAFCERHALPYCETGLLTSYAQALRHLHAIGRPEATTAATT